MVTYISEALIYKAFVAEPVALNFCATGAGVALKLFDVQGKRMNYLSEFLGHQSLDESFY